MCRAFLRKIFYPSGGADTPQKEHPWALALVMTALYALAVVVAFWDVIGADVVFVAPDAPICPVPFRNAVRRLVVEPFTLHNLVLLLPYAFAYEGTFWVDGWVMALAGVFLLRSRGANWASAWVGGFCATFVGYFATLFCAGHRGVVDALAVTCLGFGAVARAMASGRWRWFAVLGAVLALGLGAQADIWAIVVCAIGVYALWLWIFTCPCNAEGGFPRCFRCGFSAIRRRVLFLLPRFGLALGVFLLVGFPALRHTFGAAQETRSGQLASAVATAQTPEAQRNAQWNFITDWSLPPEDLAEWLLPGIHGHTSYPFDPKPYTGRMGSAYQVLRQHSVHIGYITLLLALLAWCGRGTLTARRERLFWSLLALVTLILAFGRFTPCYRLIASLPFLGQIRAPVKWLHLTGFALAMLAGIGAGRFLRGRSTLPAILLCALIAFGGAMVIRPYVFARDLHHNVLTSAVPPGATVCNAVRWSTLDDVCRWQGITLVGTPREADFLVLPVPQGRAVPVAKLRVRGILLGLYETGRQQRHE